MKEKKQINKNLNFKMLLFQQKNIFYPIKKKKPYEKIFFPQMHWNCINNKQHLFFLQ